MERKREQHNGLIIVVNDLPSLRQWREEYLTRLGYRCVFVDSDQATHVLLERKRFDGTKKLEGVTNPVFV